MKGVQEEKAECEYCQKPMSGHSKCEKCGILMHQSLAEKYRCKNCGEFHGKPSNRNPDICFLCAGEHGHRHTKPVLIRQSIGQSAERENSEKRADGQVTPL